MQRAHRRKDRIQRKGARDLVLCAVAAALLLLPSLSARAQDGDAEPEVHWSAPSDCPTVADFLAEVDHLRQQPRSRSAADAQVTAEVTRDSDGTGPYRLRLVIVDCGGKVRERRIEGETCAEVTDAAAVVLALSSDSLSSDVAAAVPAAPPVAAAPVHAAPPGEERPSKPASDDKPTPWESSTPHPLFWEFSALGGIDYGALPAPAPGFGIGVSVGAAQHRFELRAIAWLPERAVFGARATLGLDVSLYAAALRYCHSLFEGQFDFAPCAGIEAGAMVASSVSVGAPQGGQGPWFAPMVGFRGSLRITSHVALSLDVEGLTLVSQPRFVIDSEGQVFQPPPVTGRTLAGIHMRFP